MLSEICLVIPSKRKPPLSTLTNYGTWKHATIIVADPEVYQDHKQYYGGFDEIVIAEGVPGQGANKSLCYEIADKMGFKYFFRMDDDLAPKTFVGIAAGHYPYLDEVISEAFKCMEETETTLVGFHNGSNRYWMSNGYGRTYGLIHGGANLSVSVNDGALYLDPTITRGEDVYRTCAHRLDSEGYVGRVKHIGFDKKQSTQIAGHTSINVTQEQIDASRDLILQRFPGMVTCNGTREIFGGQFTIANWRMCKP